MFCPPVSLGNRERGRLAEQGTGAGRRWPPRTRAGALGSCTRHGAARRGCPGRGWKDAVCSHESLGCAPGCRAGREGRCSKQCEDFKKSLNAPKCFLRKSEAHEEESKNNMKYCLLTDIMIWRTQLNPGRIFIMATFFFTLARCSDTMVMSIV